VQTVVTISVTGGGVTRSATLTVNPDAPASTSVASVAVSPSSVSGGTAASGSVTLTAAAPAGGMAVALSCDNAAASVPASVTVAAGATSAAFSVATTAVSTSTPATITASAGGASKTTVLTVAPQAQGATLAVTATGRSGERVTSSPAGINVSVGSTGSASFSVGTAITLSVTNGRDAADRIRLEGWQHDARTRQAARQAGITLTTELVDGNEVEAVVGYVVKTHSDLLIVGIHRHSSLLSGLWNHTAHDLSQRVASDIMGVH